MGECFRPKNEGDSLYTARLLTEVDHLIDIRSVDGQYDQLRLDDVLVNLATSTQEGAQAYAVSRTLRKKIGDDYYWNGQSTGESAASGQQWYSSSEGHTRGFIEVDEVDDARRNLRPGFCKIFFSPKMTRQDASLEIAKREHLADDDAIRVAWLAEEDGQVEGMYLDSLLIRDVPLSAWIDMANDPNGLFEGRVSVPAVDSALPIMNSHRSMHVPAHKLPHGILSVIDAVVPYIKDPTAKEKVEWHVAMFKSTNQQDEYLSAENIAKRWLDFEIELAESLISGVATPAIHDFISSVDGRFVPEVQQLLIELSESGELEMTRELAAHLEAARRKTLWTAAAVLSGNEKVLSQLPIEVAESIRNNELLLQIAQDSGYSLQQLRQMESQNNLFIARQKIEIGRACAGVLKDVLGDDGLPDVMGGVAGMDQAETATEQDSNYGVIRCVNCRRYVSKADVVKPTCWECPKCRHKVDVCTGEVLRAGETKTPTPSGELEKSLQIFDGLALLAMGSGYSKSSKKEPALTKA